MKRLLFTFLLFATCCHAQTYSTGTTQACASASSCQTGTGISVSTGDLLVVTVFHGTTTTCPQASDTMVDSASVITFSQAVCAANSNTGNMLMFYGSATGSNGSDKFTAGFSASRNNPTIIVLKYTGAVTSSQLDTTSTAVATPGAPTVLTSGSFSTSNAKEVIILCGNGDLNTTSWVAGSIGAGTGTVRQTTQINGGNYAFSCEDLTVSSTQSGITASMTANAMSNWSSADGALGTFKGLSAVNMPPWVY